MSAAAQIRQMVEETVHAMLSGHGGGADSGDVTQLKRENTGLRNRVKDLEERVTVLEDRLSPPAVTAKAQTAEVKSKASGK
jgi:hypothetical protein